MLTMLTVHLFVLGYYAKAARMAFAIHHEPLPTAENAPIVSFQQFAKSGFFRRF
jgi:hypothetical protein